MAPDPDEVESDAVESDDAEADGSARDADAGDEFDSMDVRADAPGGGLDLGGLLASAQEMMAGAQAAAEEVVEGSAGGGLVTVRVDGQFVFHGISISPEAVDPDDVSLLEDLVLAALRDAAAKLHEGQQGALGGLDLGGLDLGGLDLGGLFGGGAADDG